ncbi:ACT domain-containing protein ACR9-like isoform X2 [Rhododendron vialii]|uniref:ACT domain-containing protein ACR9-like isoform X2 n=1 Tax=Rhododendron vialii TaxID=182163 RepID=UPI00265D8FBD|nr:ACT domain-containing protein ACR9-like isoform X2 [Rhododendron vialii]
MASAWEDLVLIKQGKEPGDPWVITVNCPDKVGLGCDVCRIVLDFGLCITIGDFCTDGYWCYMVLWTVPQTSSMTVDWESLKKRLLSACPSFLMSSYFNQKSSGSPPLLYMLKVFCLDRKGLLHDVTKALCQLELSIERVKVMTTPDGKLLNLFFITDNTDLLHTTKRREEACKHLGVVLGEYCISCELQLAGPESVSQLDFSPLSEAVAEELFSHNLSRKEASLQTLSPDMEKVNLGAITFDDFLSPAHTLLQIQCVDQKSVVYDILRTSKDFNIQIAYGRISPSVEGSRNVDLLIQKADGKKIVEPDSQIALCSRLKEAMLRPMRVTIANRGPDAELFVANQAEIRRHLTSDREWEVYRFLLGESREFPLASSQARTEIVDRVRRTLMGW